MSTNKLSHLKNGDKIYLQQGDNIYLEVTREISTSDDNMGLMFCGTSGYTAFVNDDDTFYFPDDLKQLANDGMPKKGATIEILSDGKWVNAVVQGINTTVSCKLLNGNYTLISPNSTEWRYPPKKTELTLAEVEKRLELEKGSLIIKD